MKGSLDYRLMKTGEEAEVCNLAVRVFGEFIAPCYAEDYVQKFLNYVNPNILRLRSRWSCFVLLATTQNRVVGMIEVRDESHISLLFVDKRFQRRGIGRELMRRGLSICQRRNPELSKVTVNSSPYAVRIYERLGFSREGLEQVKDGAQFAPMVLELPNSDLTSYLLHF